MAHVHSKTPLAKLVNAQMDEQGSNRTELMKTLGYANAAKGLRRVDAYLDTGQETSHLLKALPDVLGLDIGDVEAAAVTTRQQIEDAEEAAAKGRFHPNILVLTRSGVRVPPFVQAFAYGGKLLGRSLLFITNNRGLWSIPILFRLFGRC